MQPIKTIGKLATLSALSLVLLAGCDKQLTRLALPRR